MTDEHQTVANHIIESIHRAGRMLADERTLPNVLYLQLDNCWKEKKNGHLLSFINFLVAWGLFKTVGVGFIPKGHTHTDIHQTFSTKSRRPTTRKSITREDLQAILADCYNKPKFVSGRKNVAN